MVMQKEKLEEEIADNGVSSDIEVKRDAEGSIDLSGLNPFSKDNIKKEYAAKEEEPEQEPEEQSQKEEEPQEQEQIEDNENDLEQEEPDNQGQEIGEQQASEKMIPMKNFREYQSKKDREIAEARREIEETKKQLQWLKEMKQGDQQQAPVQQFDENEPQMPTEDDFLENEMEATRKLYRYERYQEKKQERLERQQREQEERKRRYDQEHERDIVLVRSKYPQITDMNGKLYKKAIEILQRDPDITSSPYYESYVVNQAALELGIKPITNINNNKQTTKTTAQVKKKKSYILNSKGGGASSNNSDKDLSNLSLDEWNSKMKGLFRESNGG